MFIRLQFESQCAPEESGRGTIADGQSVAGRSEISDCGAVNEQFDGLRNLALRCLPPPPPTVLRVRCVIVRGRTVSSPRQKRGPPATPSPSGWSRCVLIAKVVRLDLEARMDKRVGFW